MLECTEMHALQVVYAILTDCPMSRNVSSLVVVSMKQMRSALLRGLQVVVNAAGTISKDELAWVATWTAASPHQRCSRVNNKANGLRCRRQVLKDERCREAVWRIAWSVPWLERGRNKNMEPLNVNVRCFSGLKNARDPIRRDISRVPNRRTS